MEKRHVLRLSLLLSLACGGSTAAIDAGLEAGGVDASPAELGTDTAGDTSAVGWGAVEALLAARSRAAGVAALGLAVWDASDRQLYQHMVGGFTADTRVAVASASKLVSTLVLFDVVGRGQLTLDSTTDAVLGWTGAGASITLRHLLSFTSGLPREASCTLNPLLTLAACVNTIATAALVAPPGTRFDYGSTHLHVAARMAEVVTGRSWAQLYSETLRAPLALAEDVAYFTLPRQSVGRINPLIAGGLRASMNEYRGFLALAFHKGTLASITVGTPELFDAQARQPFPAVTIGYTPFAEARYGLGSWVMCQTPAAGCPVVTSPGAFGFTPWLDREVGYYAILGMELADTGGGDRPAAFAVKLLEELQPLIRAQLAP